MNYTAPQMLTLLLNRTHIRLRRTEWPDGDFVAMQPALELPAYNTQDAERKVNDRTAALIGKDSPMTCPPYFAYWDASETTLMMGYQFTAADLMATDWQVIPGDEELIPPNLPASVSLVNVDTYYDVHTRMLHGAGQVQVTITFPWVYEESVDKDPGLSPQRMQTVMQSKMLASAESMVDIVVRDGFTAAIMLTPPPGK